MDFNKLWTIVLGYIGFGEGHARTNQAKKNIFVSFGIKGANIITGLLMVPMVLHYIDQERYGIWITISSIIAWFGFFDIGLGNGLRNRFAEAVAKNDEKLARTFVSTAYVVIAIFSALIFLVFMGINPFINWNTILNVKDINLQYNQELRMLVIIIFSTFSFTFVLRLITIVLTANHEPAKASVFDFLGSLGNLIIVFILTKTTDGSLVILALALSISSILVLLASSIWYFNTSYKKYSPSFEFVDFTKLRPLFGLGVKFFILQMAVILLYQTNNIIIAQLFGPVEVTPYSITYRYFNYVLMLFSIVLSPLWSAFTEAWVKNDIVWVKNVVKKLKTLWIAFAILGAFMLIVSVPFFKIWIGSAVSIPFTLSALVYVYIMINLWGNIYSTFMNGVNQVKIQMYFGIGAAILNVPLAVYLGKSIGIEGIILANILVAIPGVFVYPIYVTRIINHKELALIKKQSDLN